MIARGLSPVRLGVYRPDGGNYGRGTDGLGVAAAARMGRGMGRPVVRRQGGCPNEELTLSSGNESQALWVK